MSVALPPSEGANYNQSANGLWLPSEIGSSLAAWHDPRKTQLISNDNGVVDQYNDQSGNGNNWVDFSANQPTISGTRINGRQALDSSADELNLASPVASVHSAIFVGQRKSTTMRFIGNITNQPAIEISGTTLTFGTGFFGTYVLNGDDASIPADATSHNVTISEGVPFILFVEWSAILNNTIERLFNGADGVLGESVLLTNEPSTDIRQRVEGYLAHGWGTVSALASDHPYKVRPPFV